MYNVAISGANPPDPKEIIDFLDKWLVNHILKIDKEYEDYKHSIKSDLPYKNPEAFRNL